MDAQDIPQWDEVYPSREDLAEDIRNQALYVLETGGHAAGLIVLNEDQAPEYAGVSWRYDGRALVIHRLTIDPARQGKGLASRLMDFAEETAAARGYDCIRLDAFTRNPAACALYRKRGYRNAGVVRLRKGDFHCFETPIQTTMLTSRMPSLDDPEGSTVPEGLPPVIDAHVHITTPSIASAIQKWFDEHAWHIRYPLDPTRVIDFLLSRGIHRIVALQYAHKPGLARRLNEFMADRCRPYGHRVTGLATVFPGERDAEGILQEGFDAGLGGLKLHAHVQCFDMNSDSMDRLYECCRRNRKPMVMHVGREPKSAAYNCDPYRICSAEKLERVLRDFPDLRICVPHLGLDELSAYRRLLERYDNLWLDTTMVLAGYFPVEEAIDLGSYRPDRVMYGSDFPNIPYAWDRELKAMKTTGLSGHALEQVVHANAVRFFDMPG